MNSLDLIGIRHVGYGLIQLCAHDTSCSQKTSVETKKIASPAYPASTRHGIVRFPAVVPVFARLLHCSEFLWHFFAHFRRKGSDKHVYRDYNQVHQIAKKSEQDRRGARSKSGEETAPRLEKRVQIILQGADNKYRQGESLAFFFCASRRSEIRPMTTLRGDVSCMR